MYFFVCTVRCNVCICTQTDSVLTPKIICFLFPSYKKHDMIPEQQVGLCSMPRVLLLFLFYFIPPSPRTFRAAHFLPFARFQSVIPRSRCLSHSQPPPTQPLAVMLMHSQSACPLSRRALHVHQAVQRPCMQMSSNCSGVQTPSNLLPGGGGGGGGGYGKVREATEGRGTRDQANHGGPFEKFPLSPVGEPLSAQVLCRAQRNISVLELCAGIIKSETPDGSFMFASSSSSSSLLTARHFTARHFSFLPSLLSALQKKVYYGNCWGVFFSRTPKFAKE